MNATQAKKIKDTIAFHKGLASDRFMSSQDQEDKAKRDSLLRASEYHSGIARGLMMTVEILEGLEESLRVGGYKEEPARTAQESIDAGLAFSKSLGY